MALYKKKFWVEVTFDENHRHQIVNVTSNLVGMDDESLTDAIDYELHEAAAHAGNFRDEV